MEVRERSEKDALPEQDNEYDRKTRKFLEEKREKDNERKKRQRAKKLSDSFVWPSSLSKGVAGDEEIGGLSVGGASPREEASLTRKRKKKKSPGEVDEEERSEDDFYSTDEEELEEREKKDEMEKKRKERYSQLGFEEAEDLGPLSDCEESEEKKKKERKAKKASEKYRHFQKHLENKILPPSTLEEEKEVLKKITERYRESTKAAEGEGVEEFELADEKTFRLDMDDEGRAVLGEDDKNSLLMEIKKRLNNNFKGTSDENERKYLAAAKEREVRKDGGDKFRPRYELKFYCPKEHNQYPFFPKAKVICGKTNDKGIKCEEEIKTVNSVLVIFLPDLIKVFLSVKKVYESVKKTNERLSTKYFDYKNGGPKAEIKRDTTILDISDAGLMLEMANEGFYDGETLGMCWMMFLDEVQVWMKSRSKKVCLVSLCSNECDPSFRFQHKFLIPFGGFQTRHNHNNSILNPFADHFRIFFFRPPKLTLNFFAPELKVETVEVRPKCLLLGVIIG